MFDNYTKKVPREVFEEEVRTHKHPSFAPEGPYITANEIRFTYRCGRRRIRIIASLTETDYQMSQKAFLERQVMATFNRMVKYPKYDLNDLPETFDIKQIMHSNPAFDGKVIDYAISYDMNSAFAFAEVGKIPDTDREYTGRIRRGDVGIRMHKDRWIFATTGEAYKCFPLIEWDAYKFVNLYYGRKANPKTPAEKQKAKDFLNHHVGSMKYHNQIIRCWIIWNCNKNIEAYKDENTILINTDCIISLVDRPDIPLGTDIGQFDPDKIQRGRFAKRNMDYQFYASDTAPGLIKKRGLGRDDREDFDILTPKKTGKKVPEGPSASGYNFIKGRFKK